MMAAQQNNGIDKIANHTVIVGLGKTGLSCARFLTYQNIPFVVVDSRNDPPALKQLLSIAPNVECYLGGFEPWVFEQAKTIIVSPGVSVKESVIAKAKAAGAKILGDIALLVENAGAPIIAITGSNGKSTVTTLLGEMAKQAGLSVKVGGNLGTPALDLIAKPLAKQNQSKAQGSKEDKTDFFILELSSFQLETTERLNAHTAVVLNISADHMDRYTSFEEYVAAKKAVYNNCQLGLFNRDDAIVMGMAKEIFGSSNVMTFGLGEPDSGFSFGVATIDSEQWLVKGEQKLIQANKVKLPGQHNLANALAALALGEKMNLPMSIMLEVLGSFNGLPHRMQLVANRHDVEWYNDSKGTNVGATVSAINGMVGSKILIAGGEAKDADFSPLREAVIANNVKLVILIGKDAFEIEKVLTGVVEMEQASSLHAAVDRAAVRAKAGDKVIMSPACASFDMFDNYEHRGDVFMEAVRNLPL